MCAIEHYFDAQLPRRLRLPFAPCAFAPCAFAASIYYLEHSFLGNLLAANGEECITEMRPSLVCPKWQH